MSTTQLKIAGLTALFVLIFSLGYLLTKGGKPYNLIVFTFHKLLTLGTIAFLVVTIINIQKDSPLNPLQLVVVMFMAACFLADMATGGLISTDKTFPDIIQKLHHLLPYLTIVSTAASLYLLL